ncbi:MAG: PIN domain nuclease [Desulfobacterales bacterium CG23_combo_of_CG06-09_8_20_14_all_51_8]|nr:MAG: PIN domain nuclease [Desulfobacterales bacterium CG23_combo_of_CG06-09_8_20_14_all_51_8]
MSGYLFDSHALLAFFQNEPGAEIVAKIMRSSMEQDLDRLICMINAGEILYLTKRRFGDAKKLEILSRIHQLGFKLLSVTDAIVFQAAEYKAQYAMSYADCFALACSIENSAVLITGDPEFQAVSHLVKIDWIR